VLRGAVVTLDLDLSIETLGHNGDGDVIERPALLRCHDGIEVVDGRRTIAVRRNSKGDRSVPVHRRSSLLNRAKRS
jgi:hypothetical protein